MTLKVMHLLPSLEIGGAERAVLRLANRGVIERMEHQLLLFDKPYRSDLLDFDPGNVPTDYVPRRPGVDFQFAKNLSEILINSKIDVIHAHNDTAIFYAALAKLIGRLPRTCLICTFRNRPTHATAGARISTRWAVIRAAEIVAVSQELSQWLIQTGWVKRCKTIYNGVNLTEFRPTGALHPCRSQLSIPDSAIVVGHVGRFAPIKRHVDLLKAASMLVHADPPIYFIFAGVGPLFEVIREQAASLTNVRMLSNVGDIPALLRAVDIFTLCSEHEGTPQALLEAMACARPIIATAVGGIPHVLAAQAPEPAGRLIPPSAPDQLAREILELARDSNVRCRLGRMAYRRAADFSFEQEWAEYSRLYKGAH